MQDVLARKPHQIKMLVSLCTGGLDSWTGNENDPHLLSSCMHLFLSSNSPAVSLFITEQILPRIPLTAAIPFGHRTSDECFHMSLYTPVRGYCHRWIWTGCWASQSTRYVLPAPPLNAKSFACWSLPFTSATECGCGRRWRLSGRRLYRAVSPAAPFTSSASGGMVVAKTA